MTLHVFKIKIHVGVGMNSKEREEVLDLYKHISAGLVERKGDRLMLLEIIIMVHEKGHIIIWSYLNFAIEIFSLGG